MENINLVIIAGSGIMGSSLAQIFSEYNISVILYDIEEEKLKRSLELITLNQKTLVLKNIVSEEQSRKIISNISFTCDKQCFNTAEFVLETIVENMDIKRKFWEEISKIVPKDIILATNTSGLSISKIAEIIKNPERFCGMHWVNPPHIVPLVEIIRGENTNDETMKIVYNIAKYVGKKPVIINKDALGFVLNRIQFAVLREALHIVENEIASMEDVDNVLKFGLGMRYAALGPFEIADIGGLDTFNNIASYLFADLSNAKDSTETLKSLAQKGEFGVKTKKGFYDYSNGRDVEVLKYRDEKFIDIAECLYK